MDELAGLIDDPSETLEAEYKDWLDLTDELNRANLARHVAALSNLGGGYVVFGFNDRTMASTGENPFAKGYSHDDFAGISRRFLEPVVHTSVRTIRGHTVLIVPPHGAVPVCAKQNGPGDAKGRPQGINRGTYYLRKAGPESAPIITEAEWAQVIRRCVMHDKAALLAALSNAIAGRQTIEPRPAILERWHEALRVTYVKQPGIKGTRLESNNSQFSYAIIKDGDETLPPAQLLSILTSINKEGVDRVNTGWSMFFPFNRSPIRPYFTSDPSAGVGDEEFLEANLLLDDIVGEDADMWRVAGSGLASLIRPIRLDYLRKPGWSDQFFSLNEAARNIGQMVRHAEALAMQFETASQVAFVCEWRGIGHRSVGDPKFDWSPGRVSITDSKVSKGTWPVADVIANWPNIVASLLAPLARAFDPTLELSAGWVSAQSASWRPIGNQWP